MLYFVIVFLFRERSLSTVILRISVCLFHTHSSRLYTRLQLSFFLLSFSSLSLLYSFYSLSFSQSFAKILDIPKPDNTFIFFKSSSLILLDYFPNGLVRPENLSKSIL